MGSETQYLRVITHCLRSSGQIGSRRDGTKSASRCASARENSIASGTVVALVSPMSGQSSLTVTSDAPLEPSGGARQVLARTTVVAPFHAELIALDQRTTAAQALVVIATSCLRQVAL